MHVLLDGKQMASRWQANGFNSRGMGNDKEKGGLVIWSWSYWEQSKSCYWVLHLGSLWIVIFFSFYIFIFIYIFGVFSFPTY